MAKKQKASAKMILRQERFRVALKLRKRGLTYAEIARELGISTPRAQVIVQEAFAELKAQVVEDAHAAALLEAQRLDEMWKGLYDKAVSGDTRAIEVALKIMERRANLLGLDAPKKTEIKVSAGDLSDDELVTTAKRLGLPAPELDVQRIAFAPLPGEKVPIQDAEFEEKTCERSEVPGDPVGRQSPPEGDPGGPPQ